jgi:hypothetical protein
MSHIYDLPNDIIFKILHNLSLNNKDFLRIVQTSKRLEYLIVEYLQEYFISLQSNLSSSTLLEDECVAYRKYIASGYRYDLLLVYRDAVQKINDLIYKLRDYQILFFLAIGGAYIKGKTDKNSRNAKGKFRYKQTKGNIVFYIGKSEVSVSIKFGEKADVFSSGFHKQHNTPTNIDSLLVTYYIDVATSENIVYKEKHNTLCKKHTIVLKESVVSLKLEEIEHFFWTKILKTQHENIIDEII